MRANLGSNYLNLKMVFASPVRGDLLIVAARRFRSPYVNDEKVVGLKAETIFLEILKSIGLTCWKASEFEDNILRIDLWVVVNNIKIPVQLTTSWSPAWRQKKLSVCRARRILLLYVPVEELLNSDGKSLNPECLGKVVKRWSDQLKYFQFLGRPVLTPEIAFEREQNWVETFGETFELKQAA